MSRHGCIREGFKALDSDADGWITAWDVVQALQSDRCQEALPPLDAGDVVTLADELRDRWRGCASVADFLATFGGEREHLLCLQEGFVPGAVAELAYCLPPAALHGSGCSAGGTVHAALAAPARTPSSSRPSVAAPAAQSPPRSPREARDVDVRSCLSDGRLCLCLVPAEVPGGDVAASLRRALVAESVDRAPGRGLVRVQLPGDAPPGDYEWRLLGRAGGKSVAWGLGIPCKVSEAAPRKKAQVTPGSVAGASVPRAPVAVHVQCIAATGNLPRSSVEVHWDAPPTCGAGMPDGYIVRWQVVPPCGQAKIGERGHTGTDANAAGQLVVGGSRTGCRIDGLLGGSQLTFSIVAVNRAGDSPPSAPVTICTGSTHPGPPARLAASSSGDAVELAWAAPADDGGCPILSYWVLTSLVSPDNLKEIAVLPEVLVAGASKRFRGLARGVGYRFRLQAVNRLGRSRASDASEVVWLGVVPAASRGKVCPEKELASDTHLVNIAGRGAVGHEDSSVTSPRSSCVGRGGGSPPRGVGSCGASRCIQHPQEPPSVAPGSGPTRAVVTLAAVVGAERYVVEVRRCHGGNEFETKSPPQQGQAPADDWQFWETTAKTALVVAGLEFGTTYQFAYRTVSSGGAQSERSPTSEPFTTGPRPPATPGRPWLYGPAADPPHDPLIAFPLSQQSEEVSAVAAELLQHFRCVAFVVGVPELTVEVPLTIVAVAGTVATAAINGWMANGEYRLAVQACNAGGWSALGPACAPVFVWRPLAPGRPSVIDVGGGELQLAWMGTCDDRGELITAYTVHTRCLPVVEPDAGSKQVEVQPFTVEPEPFDGAVCGGVGQALFTRLAGFAAGYSYSFAVQAAAGALPWPLSEASEPMALAATQPEQPPYAVPLEVMYTPSTVRVARVNDDPMT